jgi:hypothetical protein
MKTQGEDCHLQAKERGLEQILTLALKRNQSISDFWICEEINFTVYTTQPVELV